MENEELLENMDRDELPQSVAVSWGKQEWGFLLSALLIAGCYFFAHFPSIFSANYHLPGIGLTVSQWVLIAVSLLFAGKKGVLHFRKNPGGIFLLVIALGLGACFGVFGDNAIRAMNLPVVCLVTAAALFSLTGINPLPALSGKGLLLSLSHLLPGFFTHWTIPFKALQQIRQKEQHKKLTGLAVGILLGMPVVLIALLLLSSADQMYDSILKNGFTAMNKVDSGIFFRLGFTILFGLCLFSFLSVTGNKPFQTKESERRFLSPVPLITILVMLFAVYALFVYVQFRYLFFGRAKEVTAMGYAEYARSGFFQLVILSIFTLLLILPFLSFGKESKAVRILCALIALLTIIIDFSAFFRMRLYIQAYGLSILRLVTLWGMLMILLSLLGCIAKCLFLDLSICPILTVLSLSTWLLLNLSNPDRIVVRYQVNAYNTGVLSEFDAVYMAELSPDVLPELEKIENTEFRQKVIESFKKDFCRCYPRLYDWSLSCLNLDREQVLSIQKSFTIVIAMKAQEDFCAVTLDYMQDGKKIGSIELCNDNEQLPLENVRGFRIGWPEIPNNTALDHFSFRVSVLPAASPNGRAEETQAYRQAGKEIAFVPTYGQYYSFILSGSEKNGYLLDWVSDREHP